MFGQQSHFRSRLALVAAVASALWWSATGLPSAAQAQTPDPATQMYVSGIGVNFALVGGPKRQPLAVVDIVDGNGNPVDGALVVGDWSGCFKQLNDSAVTEIRCWTDEFDEVHCVGTAVIWANKTYSCWGQKRHERCSFTFTITSVSKEGMTYVPVEGMTTRSVECR